MASFDVNEDRFDPTVRKIGLVAGLLAAADPGKVKVLLDWFGDPLGELRKAPQRRSVLLPMLREQLGGDPVSPGSGQKWSWYSLDRSRLPHGVFVVLPEADDAGDESVVGVGLRALIEGSNGKVEAYAHVPLFTIPPKLPNPLVLGDAKYPIRVWIDASNPAGDVSMHLYAELRFSGSPVFNLEVKAAGLTAAAKKLSELRSDPVRTAIKELLKTALMTDWLGRKLGDSGFTVASFLEAIHIIAKEGGAWVLAPLDQFSGASDALTVAQIVLADILTVLASTGKPLFTFKQGAFFPAIRAVDAKTKDLGFRFAAPDLDTRKADKTSGIVAQLGKWLSKEDDAGAWVHRDGFDPDKSIKEAGIVATMLRIVADGASRTFSFRPAIEMASIGFDAVGPKGKPLIDVRGFRVEALEVRYYFRADFQTSAVVWGGAVRCRAIGIPLGAGLKGGGNVQNPVVQNLLSSGERGAGSDNTAPNPAFTATVARIVRSGSQMALWLDPSAGAGKEGEVAFPIQSSFGPLRCTKMTVRWPADNPNHVLTFALDASVTIQSLHVGLVGFAVGIPLKSPGQFSTYSFALAGLGVSFEAPPISVEAALVTRTSPDGTARYDGTAVMRAKNWSVAALGSYTVIDHAPSMFLFGFFRRSMGGPPFAFVTGICAGFGYNRSLKLPARDKVNEFPLLAALDNPNAVGGEKATPDVALDKLKGWVEPAHGTHWLAAGLQFTTYQLVKTNAILFVIFGGRNEVALLGVSRMRLPQSDEAREFAYAELGIQATLQFDDGFIGVSAILSPNSYVLTPECRLTGGFAFYAWFGGQHNGDFVLTLGGYHPAFVVPPHYPVVPRLGFSWHVSDSVTISGEAYFAITPSCAMGGGMLQVQFHSGDLHAWFIARADFLLQWKPFYYTGSVSVSIGVSYRLNLLFTSVTLSVELGASLEIWGPPTGGRVYIDWYIISFGISFGADRQSANAIDWDKFDQLLPRKRPPQTALLAAAANDDLRDVITIAFAKPSEKVDDRWIVRPATLQLSITQTMPITEISVGSKKITPSDYSTICVRPMKKCDVASKLVITITQEGSGGGAIPIEQWTWSEVYGGVPAGMWGEPVPGESGPPPSSEVLPHRLLGIEKLIPPKVKGTGPDQFPASRVAHQPVRTADGGKLPALLPLRSDAPAVVKKLTIDPDRIGRIAATIASADAKTQRAALASVLATLGIDTNDDMSKTSSDARVLFVAAPFAGAPWESAA